MGNDEKYRLIFEHSPLAIMATDARGVIVACNARATEVFGAPRERLLGFSYEEIRDERMKSAIHEALSGVQSRFRGEYLTVTGNVLRNMNAHFAPGSSQGCPSGVIGVFDDVGLEKQAQREWEDAAGRLQKALSGVKTLRGLLPICSRCKSIREGQTWIRLEEYLEDHAEVKFTHSLCPECARRVYPELF